MLKDTLKSLVKLDEEIQALLKLEPLEIRDHLVDTMRSLASNKDEAILRRERLALMYLIDRMQDMEKDNDPPFGREKAQIVLDMAARMLEKSVMHLTKSQVIENFSSSTTVEVLNKEGRFLATAMPQDELMEKLIGKEDKDIRKDGGIILPKGMKIGNLSISR